MAKKAQIDKELASSIIGDDNVTDPNQIIDQTNSQPDYYTADLNEDLNIDEKRSTTATQGLSDVTDEFGEISPEDELSLTPEEDINEDGLNTTTDTARFTDLGGVTERGRNDSFNEETGGLPAGTAGHPGTDADTD